MIRFLIFTQLAVSILAGGLFSNNETDPFTKLKCPDPSLFVEANPTFPIECVTNAIPPWPICLLHSTEYFINASVSSAGRCCDFNNLTACKCPYKYYDMWQTKMGPWCEAITKCPVRIDAVDENLVTDFWATFINK
jgi:hypothetical protein